MQSIPRPSGGRRMRTIVGIALVVALGTGAAVAATAPANAAADVVVRNSLPVRGGTALIFNGAQVGSAFSPDQECTAGPVLRASGILSSLTQYQRAVRYVATAGHCASAVGQVVRVNDVNVGTVQWISTQSDLAIVRIEPTSTRYTQCHHTSGGFLRCQIVVNWLPRAGGQVILGYNRVGRESFLPVQGTGTPAARELFCITGARTGSDCNYRSVPTPPGSDLRPHEVVAENPNQHRAPGDSGAPVVSRSGLVYGVFVAGGDPGPAENLGAYIPISELFREQPSYRLAID